MAEMKLLLGSGEWHWPDYVTLDADPMANAMITAAVPPLPVEVRAMQWDEIMAIHFIEHLYPADALQLLTECHGVLKPFGRLILEQPDLAYAARVLLGQEERPPEEFPGQFDLAAFYGDVAGHHGSTWWGHKWGYTRSSLVDVLVMAGFERHQVLVTTAEYHQPRRDFRVIAMKGSR